MTTTTIEGSQPGPVAAGKGTFRIWARMIGYGFLSWAVVFVAAMVMFPWRAYNRPLFESSIAVVLAATIAVLCAAYFGGKPKVRARDGLVLGIAWAAINLLVDLVAFSAGPMKMAPGAYFADIGVTYLMIPVLTTLLAAQRCAGVGAERAGH